MHWREHYARKPEAQLKLAPLKCVGSGQRRQLEPAFLTVSLAIAVVAGLAAMMAWQ